MSENRRLALFGASGGTGVHLIPLLLERGFRVRAMVRDRSSIPLQDERLEIVRGDLLDPTATGQAIAGTDAVISLAGPRRLRDGARFEAELARTDLDWTVLRPPALNHLAARGHYRRGIAEHLRSPFRLSRADLARAVLDQLDDPATVRKWIEVAW